MITDHFYEGSTPQYRVQFFVKQELFSCSFVKAHRQPLARCSLLGEANYHCCLLCRLLHFLLLLLLIFFSKLSLLGKVLRWAVYRQDTLLINQCILCAADWMYRASIKLLRIFYQMLMGNKLSWMDSVQAKQTTCMLSLGSSFYGSIPSEAPLTRLQVWSSLVQTLEFLLSSCTTPPYVQSK